MTALVLLRLQVSLRHLVRGRPGNKRWLLRVVVLALLVLAAEALVFWLSSHPPQDAGVIAQLYGPVGIVVGATAGGAIVLLVEASRDHLGSTTSGSQVLPLSRAQLVIVDSAPFVLLTLGLVLVTIPPVAGLLRATGADLAGAFAHASCAVTLGVAVTTVVVLAAALIMPGPRWATVRLPLALLGAAAALVAGVVQTVVELVEGRRSVAGELLVLPRLIRQSLEGSEPSPVFLAITAVAAVAAVVVLLPVAAGRGWGSRTAVVHVTWRGGGAVGQVQADLLFVVRSPMMIANAVSVPLVLVAAVVCILALDRHVAEALVPLLVVVGCALAASVVRLQRGLLPTVRTPQQLVGCTVGAFTASQLAVATVLMAVLLSPLMLLAIRPPLAVPDIGVDVAASALVAYALAVLSSWSVPIDVGKGATQALAAFVTSAVTVVVIAAIVQLPAEAHAAAVLLAAGSAVLAVLIAWRLEVARWRGHVDPRVRGVWPPEHPRLPHQRLEAEHPSHERGSP